MYFSKYHAKKLDTPDGKFDSKKEYQRWCELKLMEKAGQIKDLKRQVKYEILPKYELNGKKIRGISYVADFVYEKNGSKIVEDCKGFKTPVYKIKKKMFEYKYQIELKES